MDFLNIGGGELLVIILLALLLFGPEDIMNLMRQIGKYTRAARRAWAQVTAGLQGDVLPDEIQEAVDDTKSSMEEVKSTLEDIEASVDEVESTVKEEVSDLDEPLQVDLPDEMAEVLAEKERKLVAKGLEDVKTEINEVEQSVKQDLSSLDQSLETELSSVMSEIMAEREPKHTDTPEETDLSEPKLAEESKSEAAQVQDKETAAPDRIRDELPLTASTKEEEVVIPDYETSANENALNTAVDKANPSDEDAEMQGNKPQTTTDVNADSPTEDTTQPSDISKPPDIDEEEG